MQLFQQTVIDLDGIAQRVQQTLVMSILARAVSFGCQRSGRERDGSGTRESDPRVGADRRHLRISQASIGHREQPGYFFRGRGDGLQPPVLVPMGEGQGITLQSDRPLGG